MPSVAAGAASAADASAPFRLCVCSAVCASTPVFFFLRRLRRRERPEVSFGGGRFSASASATSWIDASFSRAASISCVARGV